MFFKKNEIQKIIAACILSGCFLIGKAQTFERKIDWQSNPKSFYTIDGKTIIQPTFTKAAHNDQFDLLPFYTELIPIAVSGDVSVQIVNTVYSTSDHLDNAGLSFIKESIEPKAELSLLRKQPTAFISFSRFVKTQTEL